MLKQKTPGCKHQLKEVKKKMCVYRLRKTGQ